MIAHHKFIKFWVIPHTNKTQVFEMNPTADPVNYVCMYGVCMSVCMYVLISWCLTRFLFANALSTSCASLSSNSIGQQSVPTVVLEAQSYINDFFNFITARIPSIIPYVRTYVCMYVCMYACMYVCMYVCTYVCTLVSCCGIMLYSLVTWWIGTCYMTELYLNCRINRPIKSRQLLSSVACV